MSAARQISSLVDMNTRALRSRAAASFVIVVGMAAVVAVTLSVISMSAGLLQMSRQNTAPDRMVVLALGANGFEGRSSLSRDDYLNISGTPGVKKGADGKPLTSGEIGMGVITPKRSTGWEVFACLRGIDSNVLELRPEFKLIEGRMFKPGLRELVAGSSAVRQFEGVALNSTVALQSGPWTIVGVIESPGTFGDCIFGDVDTMMASLRRNAFNLVTVRLEDGSESARTQFADALKSNPSLKVEVESEETFYERRYQGTRNFYNNLAYGVAGIMGLGALLAALNTMYSAVAARVIEIATLRAIGFGAAPVAISVIAEALALAFIGAAAGSLIALLAFNGQRVEMAEYGIERAVTPLMMVAGVGGALIVAVIGAVLPAVRAARLPVTVALQAR